SCSEPTTSPVISGDLIPVIITDDGTVTKADTSTKWYSYCEKKWANAVILEDKTKTYNNGDIIPEDNIQSYFVWIPKYKYRLWNVESTTDTKTALRPAHSIDIVFDITNTIDEEGVSCATPMTSGGSGNCSNGEYMTHPAFISLDVNGIWVGKFETGYKGATSTASAQVNANDSTKIIVKPNVYSWRNSTIYNMFMSSYNYERELGSHMMKNSEWGAVAILSHSKYGIDKEVNINNNSSFKTGYSSLLTISQGTFPGTYGDGENYNKTYNTKIGYLASTTGNITGVYDMSGGALEYMAAYISGNVGSSGFDETTIAIEEYKKYLDVYSSSSAVQTYQYRILGDATGEMGPFLTYNDGDGTSRYHNSWYADYSIFVESSNPWFHRGGVYYNGVLAGQFTFDRHSGTTYGGLSFRLVLAY
ncbi:MAG: hypothetical protein ACI31M_00815, partial [Bacilli bacterium]